MSPTIHLVRMGRIDLSVLEFTAQCIRDHFQVTAKISPRKIDVEFAYDAVRKQYNSSQLLREIIKDPPDDALKVFGLTKVDLFLPIFTFLFGEAQLNGIGGLLSVHRLHNKFYGLPEDRELFQQRLKKEVIHELGHNFGLLHCQDPVCVMRSSTYVEDVDQKSEEFCMPCLSQLKKKLEEIKL